MSSCVIAGGPEGFVVSTDRIVVKTFVDDEGKELGKFKGSTRKLFQLDKNVIVAGVGNWDAYFPIFNTVARLGLTADKSVAELRRRCQEAVDARVYILYRRDGDVHLDVIDLGHLRIDQPGAVIYPDESLNRMFVTLYESPEAMRMRQSGMMGIAAIINAFNAFALGLCPRIEGPFDTICFLKDGMFEFSGSATKLPVGNFT
jgi:hypothetical protein